MSYLSDEQFGERLTSPKNLANPDHVKVVKKTNAAHPHGFKAYTNEQRAHSVKLARVMGRENASKVTGIPAARIGVYKNGQATQGVVDKELRQMVNDQVMPIRAVAADLVLRTLGIITSEEIGKEKLRDRISIARDLSVIVDKTRPVFAEDKSSVTANVIFYAPRVRDIDEYEKVS